MDLIEVLWKQDVDLGFSLELPEAKTAEKPDKPETANNQNPESPGSASLTFQGDDVEKLKALKEVNNDSVKVSLLLFFLIIEN